MGRSGITRSVSSSSQWMKHATPGTHIPKLQHDTGQEDGDDGGAVAHTGDPDLPMRDDALFGGVVFEI
jgi:hypothetical protein